MRWIGVVLSVVGLVLLGSVAAWAGPAAAAQEASPAAPPAALSPLLRQWVDGVTAGDGAAVAALYAGDAVHEDVPAGTVARGPEAIGALVSGTVGQFADVRYDVVAAHESADLGVLEYRFATTDLESGRPLDVRGVYLFELEGGKIRRSADYYDVAGILAQMGLLEMGGGTAEATPSP